MRIAIAGGTGLLGGHVASELRSRGHEVRVLSRRSPEYPVDLTTGEGLERALTGCDAVVDAANAAKQAARTLVDGSARLLAAEEAAGVGHHVGVSVVGCELLALGYFQVKARQERVIEQGPVPWSLVRATQFHELVAATFASADRWRVLPVPRAALQTVASAEVARVGRLRRGSSPPWSRSGRRARGDRRARPGPDVAVRDRATRAAGPGAAARQARPGTAGGGADRRAARRSRHRGVR